VKDPLKTLSFENKKRALSAVLFAAAIFLGWKVLIHADVASLKKFNKEISDGRKKQAALQDITALEEDLAAFEPCLSKTGEADCLIEAVSRLAAESGLALVSVTPRVSGEESTYLRIGLEVEASGSYHALGHFLEKIENNKPLIKVRTLRVSAPDNRAASEDLRINLWLGAYASAKGTAS